MRYETVKIWNENCALAGHVAPDDAPEGDVTEYSSDDTDTLLMYAQTYPQNAHDLYLLRSAKNALRVLDPALVSDA